MVQRSKLLQEIKESPLNYVDEYMTEDIYTNILKQSLNPGNSELKKIFLLSNIQTVFPLTKNKEKENLII